MDKGSALMDHYRAKFAEVNVRRDELVDAEQLFELPVTEYAEYARALLTMDRLEVIYALYAEQKKALGEWSSTLWSSLDITILDEGIDVFARKAKKMPDAIKEMALHKVLTAKIKDFKQTLPLLEDLKHEALRQRHWEKLMEVTGTKFDMNPATFTLGNLFEMGLHNFKEQIGDILGAAVKELNIEKGIAEVKQFWRGTEFTLIAYRKGEVDTGRKILGPTDEITLAVDEYAMSLQSMSASRFVGPFMQTVQEWEKKLSNVGEVIEVWVAMQQKWCYLEGIFLAGDIRQQLPAEAKRFDGVDKGFAKIIAACADNQNVIDTCNADGRLEELEQLQSDLEACQKALTEYLDSKRNAFPRFFFISDDELLSILGASECQCVQEHIIKMYDNVRSLRFGTGANKNSALGMISGEAEEMLFKTPVLCEGKVEEWMTDILDEMRLSERLITKEAIFKYCDPSIGSRSDWVAAYQGMVGLAGTQVWWTWETEDVFRKVAAGDKKAMKAYSAKLHVLLDELVERVRDPGLSRNERKKINTLLIIDVHARDIISSFVRDSILDIREFEWESQLRFYWVKEDDNLEVRQCTGTFGYGYEYMGLNGRLVITPLTDRVYLTLTQALAMFLGGAPAGPAGTGKTESVKDLAKAMGLLCVVTNCGEGMDYQACGKIFSGLAQCGAWGCFDEFNRIDVSVLSVISSQLKTVYDAIKMNLTRFQFEGLEISLDRRVGIFITMNPGYAGRTELPESVKALFRPVVVIVPDLQQICQIMLFSEGFVMAGELAKKMTILYKLAKAQLSKQHHYDFALRALKSVLVMAGSLKRGDPDLPEDMVLMRALRDMNLPKFVFEDVPLFQGLLSDLFPGLDCPRVGYPKINKAIEESMAEQAYRILPVQVDKVVQLYETMLTRHTTMVVGNTGGGKSVVIKALADAQNRLKMVTKLYTLNAKATTVNELYGILDPVTRDWQDGLLSKIFREICRALPEGKTAADEKRIIMFDSDVDALWVENMNSVMDDNKVLTLPNGERIRLPPHCALLVEVADLQYASPATISRCGMVYVDPKNLGYRPFWERWLETRAPEQQELFSALFEVFVPKLIDRTLDGVLDEEVFARLSMVIPRTNLNMVQQLCDMITSMLRVAGSDELAEEAPLKAVFICAVAWACGGALLDDDRVILDKVIKQLAGLPTDAGEGRVPAAMMPTGQSTLFDYFFDASEGMWVPWKAVVPEYVHDPAMAFHEILVPTQDTMRISWLLRLNVTLEKPVLLVGESGTSKTATTQSFLNTLDKSTSTVLNMSFSSRTKSIDVQRNLEANVEKRTKDTYGPPPGKRLLVFIDDMNMPQVDTYGTQQPIALMKLLIEKGGLYNRWPSKDLTWKSLKDLGYVAAMGKPGGGRNPVDPRFISLFSVYNVSFPSQVSLMQIYNSILGGHLQAFPAAVQAVGDTLTTMTIALYRQMVQTMPPTPAKFHYQFNLRDLSRVYEGLCLTTPEVFGTAPALIRVWRHECLRVLHDRLISEEDKRHPTR